MPETPPYDPESLEQLRAINPDDGGEFLRELLGIFLTDTPKRIEEIQTSLAAGDAVTLTRAAHSIKGSSGNFGAATLSGLAQSIEQAGKSASLGEVATLLPTLRDEFDRVRTALEQVKS